MKYAIIKLQGLQYKVQEGSEIAVTRLPVKEGEEQEIKEVLLVVDEGKVVVGKPLVEKAKVVAKIVKHFLGKKLTIMKFKAKVGYRRRMGFRSQLTLLKIEKISA